MRNKTLRKVKYGKEDRFVKFFMFRYLYLPQLIV